MARAAAALVALAVLTGCSGEGTSAGSAGSGSTTHQGDRPDDRPGRPSNGPSNGPSDEPSNGSGTAPAAPRLTQYVALGDSYTAAPLVPVTDLAGGCLRSNGNYPHLLAEELGARLTDVSCGGATTQDLTSRQVVGGGRGTVPPQLRAVRKGTDLVTLGIGGNDGGIFARLATECVGPDLRPRQRCGALGGALPTAARVVAETGQRVADALRTVRTTAPGAEVVLVGYPRLADPATSCPGLPLSTADRTAVARLERRLDAALRRAASAAGARFLEVHDTSRGHEICAEDPWVNGGQTDPERALAFHPFPVGQQAVADALGALLQERR